MLETGLAGGELAFGRCRGFLLPGTFGEDRYFHEDITPPSSSPRPIAVPEGPGLASSHRATLDRLT